MTTVKTLKLNIAAQAEYDWLNLLISEFTEDQSISKSPRSVKDRQEALWKLIGELKLVFSSRQQTGSHALFAETTQLTEDGYQRMFTCYRSGIKRMDNIVEQDIIVFTSVALL